MNLPKTPSFSLSGRRALVTGASSGIGLAAAAALAEYGAHVVCAARGTDRLTAAVEALRENGGSAEALTLDLSKPESLADQLASAPAFDILVNSAGVARHGPALETTGSDYDDVMGVNLKGAHFLSAAVARTLIAEGKPGSIIHVSSQMAHVGGVDRSVYCASKHGLEGMVKAMAIEWGRHGVRINTVCPTFVQTPLTEATFADPDRRRWIEEKIKLGRVARVEDLMGAVVYLASDASAMVTGTALRVDGGWTAE